MAKKKNVGRFSLAISPYTLWAIKRLAEYENISANQYIANVLDTVVAKHSDALKPVWLADEKARSAVASNAAD